MFGQFMRCIAVLHRVWTHDYFLDTQYGTFYRIGEDVDSENGLTHVNSLFSKFKVDFSEFLRAQRAFQGRSRMT